MELLHGEAVTVIDLRGPEAFGGAHITGAVNIGAGAVLPMEVTSIVSFGPMSALHRAVMPSNFVQRHAHQPSSRLTQEGSRTLQERVR